MNNQNQKQCYFCVNDVDFIDWKDTEILKKFISPQYKITPRKKNGVCAKHQRRLTKAIKRARIAALLPFTPVRRK